LRAAGAVAARGSWPATAAATAGTASAQASPRGHLAPRRWPRPPGDRRLQVNTPAAVHGRRVAHHTASQGAAVAGDVGLAVLLVAAERVVRDARVHVAKV